MFGLIPFESKRNDLTNFFSDFDKFFDNFGAGMAEFKTDIMDKGDKFVLQAELPGFQKEDISIGIDGDYLTISAQHKEETEDQKDNYIRKERRYGSYSRSFNVSDIKVEDIQAEYKNGILELDLPKQSPKAPEGPKQIEIK